MNNAVITALFLWKSSFNSAQLFIFVQYSRNYGTSKHDLPVLRQF